MNIDEYVPAVMPIISATAKSLMVRPPKKKTARSASNVVKLVFSDRAIVWLMLTFTTSASGSRLMVF